MFQSRKIIGIALIGLGLTSSCRKFLNVNTNPNVAQSATVQTLLPAAQLYVGSALGVDLQIDGSFWAQYWTQSISASQYHILDQYSAVGQDQFAYPWGNLYTANENFFQLYKLADSTKKKQYMAISLLMQAYTFELITDGWGNVPFTQALKGQFADSNITSPRYDSQAVVYNGIMAYVDSANNLLSTSDPLHPGADDLIYGGSMAEWQKFSNTLKLKMLLRLSSINPTLAQSGVQALYASTATSTFIGSGDDARIKYGFNSTNNSPLYAEELGLGGVQNLVGSQTCIDSMNSNSDPRVTIFYETNSAGSYAGLQQGLFSGNFSIFNYSIPSYNVAGDAQNPNSGTAPVNFLTSWESYFLQAEAVARGWAPSTVSDQTLFLEGIQASFLYYDADFIGTGTTGAGAYAAYIAAAAHWTQYPAAGTLAQKLPYIITQKWFAMCGNQGFEAWCEWRRTTFPNFLEESATATGAMPRRFLYPTIESTTNANFPGLQSITTPVWWDVN